MIRVLTLAATASLIGSIVAVSAGEELLAFVLGVLCLLITVVLMFRRLFYSARDAVRDAGAFASGDVQKARIVSVGDPRGWLNPKSTVALELEAADGVTKREFDREIPVPFMLAWGYRLSKRFKLPVVSEHALAEMMSFEFRREGMDVSVSREGARSASAAAPPG
jgi:hypothetical protein